MSSAANEGRNVRPRVGVPVAPLENYSMLGGFPEYPLNGNENNIFRLFSKTITRTDAKTNLQIVGPNRVSFATDVRSKLKETRDPETGRALANGYNIPLTVVNGDDQKNGYCILKVCDGDKVFLVWKSFLDGVETGEAKIKVKKGQQVFGWCKWERDNDEYNLRIIVQLFGVGVHVQVQQ